MKAGVNQQCKGMVRFKDQVLEALIELSYTTEDPLAVTMTVGGVPWVFGRDLLAAGSGGEGHVHVQHAGLGLDTLITLTTSEGCASVVLPTDALVLFLDHTYTLTPKGSEHYPVDDWIEKIVCAD